MTKRLLGADPELLLKDVNGKWVASCGKFGGTKDKPRDLGEGCAVQEDNVTVEFNIPPADSKEAFVWSLQYAMNKITEEAKAMGLNVSCTASARYDETELAYPAAKVFGCERDFNAWKLGYNPRPQCDDPNLRSAGGHVHVSLNADDPHYIDVVRAMDLFLGVPSVLLDPDKDRRQLYGKAGACRSKSYGVEYRTLSNFWLGTKELAEWVYDQTLEAVEFAAKGKFGRWEDADVIQQAINESDKTVASSLINKYGVVCPAL